MDAAVLSITPKLQDQWDHSFKVMVNGEKQNFPSHLKLLLWRDGLMNSPIAIATKCLSRVMCSSSCEVKVTTVTVNRMIQCREICRGDSYNKGCPEALGGGRVKEGQLVLKPIFFTEITQA